MFEVGLLASVSDVILFLIGLFFLNRFIFREKSLGHNIKNSAFVLGYAIAISGSLLTNGTSFNLDYILYTSLDILIVLVLLFISSKINNRIILYKLDNEQLIKDGNLSVPLIESGLLVATSIILFSSMYGDGKYTDGFIFFILGQICLIAMVLVYEKFTKFDDFELIKNNNISVATVISIMVIGFSLVVGVSIFGDSSPEGLQEDIIAFAYFFGFGVIFLIIFLNSFVDKVFFPEHHIEKEIEKDNFQIVLPYSITKLALILIIANVLS